jgi:putative ABC transport system permease protein
MARVPAPLQTIVRRYPRLRPQVVAEIFAFTSIVVFSSLIMIAFRRQWERALLRLVGATPGQIRAMVRGEAALIVTVGLGAGLALRARIDALGIGECDG